MDNHVTFWEQKNLQIWGSLVYSLFLLSLSHLLYTVSRIILLCLCCKMLREIARKKFSSQASHILYLTRYRDTQSEKFWKLSHLFSTWNNIFLKSHLWECVPWSFLGPVWNFWPKWLYRWKVRKVWSYTSGFWLYCISRQLWGFWVWWTFSKLCPKPQFCLGNIKIHLGFGDFFGWFLGEFGFFFEEKEIH